ncbi:hypothetical protein L3Q82_023575 [Scortum barcoo]|uniref:Uncharacterized protein n=1 Tax=Scortum barcoo TaxID=214431 RepID=A0ACB8WVY8_9TELE|nr:hypothetical protein L3Q82_023575 [Scortum barcoo]
MFVLFLSPSHCGIVPFVHTVNVAEGPTGEADPAHTCAADHGVSRVQPSHHPRPQHHRRRPGSEDGAQPAPARLQSDDLEHAECRVGTTNEDGRCPGLISREAFGPGMYKLRFETGSYWKTLGQTCFYPYVEVVFTISDPEQRFHLPLLMSRFSYSTYRGS